MSALILLIEDDQRLANTVCRFLNSHNLKTEHLSNGKQLSSRLIQQQYDLILCDVMLPGSSGFDLAQDIRRYFDGPLLFISALRDTQSELQGFAVGGDDYIAKPIDPDILLARIRSRLNTVRTRSTLTNAIELGNLYLDTEKRSFTVAQNEIHLTPYEFEIMWLLVQHPGTKITRNQLFDATVGREYDGVSRTIDGRISRLRRKLDNIEDISHRIITFWGQGYMLSEK